MPVFDRRPHGISAGTLKLILSPLGTHRAMLWNPASESYSWLWIDGRAVKLPFLEQHRQVVTDQNALLHWISERLLSLEITLDDHPLQTWGACTPLGRLHGLMLVDAQTLRLHTESPGPEASWTEPQAHLRDEYTLEIFADGQQRQQGACARVIDLRGLLNPAASG